ncbi:MAG: flagellar biosynthetic protein FliO [Desulfomonilia bacterium]
MNCLKPGLLLVLLIAGLSEDLLAADVPVAGVSLRAITALIGVMALLFFLAWALKKYGPVARVKKNLGLDILGQMAIGAKAHLALVRVGRSILLLGVTQNTVSLIKDLEEGEFEKALEDMKAFQRKP